MQAGISTLATKTVAGLAAAAIVTAGAVEVKHVDLPPDMQRAMARQAEAEREKRAKIIHAAGELEASEKLAQAADIISKNPATLQLRYLQTLLEMGVNNNTTIVFPLPIELFDAFTQFRDQAKKP